MSIFAPVLVRFSCGCVGARPNEKGESLVIDRCDSDRDSDGRAWVEIRDLSDKTWEPVDKEREKRLVSDLIAQLIEARKYRDLAVVVGDFARTAATLDALKRINA
jgi:predicted CopG family antitoxin